MKVYDYVSADVVEVTEAQYCFIEAIVKHAGNEKAAAEEAKVSQEVIDGWKKDPVFWPTVRGHVQVLVQSRGLTPEYVKAYLLGTIVGKEKPTPEQIKAIGHSVRALGMGLAPRAGLAGKMKMTATPEGTTIEFNDGLVSEDTNK